MEGPACGSEAGGTGGRERGGADNSQELLYKMRISSHVFLTTTF